MLGKRSFICSFGRLVDVLACELYENFRFYFIPSVYILISMYIRTFFFLASTLFIARSTLFYCSSCTQIFFFLWFAFCVPHFVFFPVFTVNVLSFVILTPFSILGHFLCFLVRCVCDVYGYCNVFVCACLDNFPELFVFVFILGFNVASSVVSICFV